MKSMSLFLKISSFCLLLSTDTASADNSCKYSSCGCWADATLSYRLNIADKDNNPIRNVQAFCDNETTPLGKSDATGLLQFSVKTAQSPTCGMKRCGTIKLSDPFHKSSTKTVYALLLWFILILLNEMRKWRDK